MVPLQVTELSFIEDLILPKDTKPPQEFVSEPTAKSNPWPRNEYLSNESPWGEFKSEGPLPPRRGRVIGIVYLMSSSGFDDPLHVGELNIGIILAEDARGKGHARRAIDLVASRAFDQAQCHRLQARLLGHVAKDRALCLFTEM